MTSPESKLVHITCPGVQWRLRMAAAERGVWTGTQLRRLLAERAGLHLSAASVSALFTKQPSQVKLSTLAALCTALDCVPGDLLVLSPAIPPPVPVAVRAGPAGRKPWTAVLGAVQGRSLPPL
ncbi:helix-turn-helix domain-containing protein [Streptomyces sp. NBC_01727]|uniref:helix-turn-helix domain-containing protein n=1 Tax=Streptomyces sp. NBC_01727 TaxID=2975924 RepID=UPI002E0DCEC7|nr:helix-turn-helix transcriptional regulator [Streptomyces sp. NBC_01727]WSG86763.1 helix-turn-helix transcriptional regulator [Streptomyces sp. NBC_01727]